MIDIDVLRSYYRNDTVLMTQHSSERCRQRGIKKKDIRHAIMTGEIIDPERSNRNEMSDL